MHLSHFSVALGVADSEVRVFLLREIFHVCVCVLFCFIIKSMLGNRYGAGVIP